MWAKTGGPRETHRSLSQEVAHGIVTTRWAGLGGRRLDVRDVVALNRAFCATRLGPAMAPRVTARYGNLHGIPVRLSGTGDDDELVF